MELEFTSDDTMTAVEAKIAREKDHLLISECLRLNSSGGSLVPDPVGYSESVSDPMGHSEFVPGARSEAASLPWNASGSSRRSRKKRRKKRLTRNPLAHLSSWP